MEYMTQSAQWKHCAVLSPRPVVEPSLPRGYPVSAVRQTVYNVGMEPNLTETQQQAIDRLAQCVDKPGSFDRFRQGLQQVLSVPKDELERRETDYQKNALHGRKKAA